MHLFETPFPAFDSQLNDEPAPLTNIKFHLLTFLQVLFSKKSKKKNIKKKFKTEKSGTKCLAAMMMMT